MDKFQLEQYFTDFKETFLPKEFEWRRGQKEAIEGIIEAYFDPNFDTVILDAPVGSGKSLIAMCSAWILTREGKKGYLLASDIALQDQYEKDFERFHLAWGSVKGVDNYMCIDNMDRSSMGTCRIKNLNPYNMDCFDDCPYYSARKRASGSSASLLNYAYWLVHMNYVNMIMSPEKQLFKPRDFAICDEGHKVLDIVQNNYSPRVDTKTIEKIQKLTDFFLLYKVCNHSSDYVRAKELIRSLWIEEDQDKLLSILEQIHGILKNYLGSIDRLKTRVQEDYPKDNPPKEWREALWISSWVTDLEYKFVDYVDIIQKTSTRNLVKNPQGEDMIVFNCLKESYLMHKYFHRWTGFRVFMSATFADPSDYLLSLSLRGAKYIKVESSFDFSKSPIYFYNKRKMSYNHINGNLPWLYEQVNDILDQHKGESGIIHSASYDLSMKIFQNLTPKNRKRVLVYSGTEEKRKTLELLKFSKDKVLIGPSLLEGLDLKDDWSRFQVFAKVPYLSLGDRFVKAKLAINPAWYQWKSIISLLQGTGRSIRSETDYATTYILDACLCDLIHNSRKSFPKEFLDRIIIVSDK
jgi:ATP-dependent DNA helicase DinG